MSIRVMDTVWRKFPQGGPALLCLLALADWCDDDGGNLYPSIAKLAVKMRVTRRRTQEAIRALEESGFVEVVGNRHGGAPGTTRHYRINVSLLASLPDTGAVIDTGAENSTGAENGGRRVLKTTERDAENSTQSVIKPLENHEEPAGSLPVPIALDNTSQLLRPKTRERLPSLTLSTWLKAITAEGQDAIPTGDLIFGYAEKAGIPADYLRLCWLVFKERYTFGTGSTKRYADWRATFRNAVRAGWFRLWAENTAGDYFLTQQGKEAARYFDLEIAA